MDGCMIHGSYGRNNCSAAKELVDNANFIFTKKLIGCLNADQPLSICQLLWRHGDLNTLIKAGGLAYWVYLKKL